MHVAAVALEQAGEHARGIVGILGRIHGGFARGERVPTVVNLEEPVPVTSVAHYVVPGVGAGAAGLLRGDRGKQVRIEAVTAARALDLRRECDARVGESGSNGV